MEAEEITPKEAQVVETVPEVADGVVNEDDSEPLAVQEDQEDRISNKTQEEVLETEAAEGQVPVQESVAEQPPPPAQPQEEEVDIDLTDPEVQAAASMIQAKFKGRFGRKFGKTGKAAAAPAAAATSEVSASSSKQETKPAEAEQAKVTPPRPVVCYSPPINR